TVQRWTEESGVVKADARTTVERPAPNNKLSEIEVQAVLDACHRPDTAHLPPTQIVPRLADEGVYLASESTFYRILKAEGMDAQRGRAHPPCKVKLPTTHTTVSN
ncbi:integrase, catalytic region, partial [mine drainage metagenome]